LIIKMPIPTPNPNEKQSDFIGRCISTLKKLDPNKPDKQIQAICFDTWRRKKLSKELSNLKFK